ncbi:MAG: ABC transporter permease [Halobacteria archaeon]
MTGFLRKLKAVFGVAFRQVKHEKARSVLAVLGVTVAVLATTLLASTGVGVYEVGQEKFQSSGQELWVTGGPLRIAPGRVGAIQNNIVDIHEVAGKVRGTDGVNIAAPMSFQTVYVGKNSSALETVVGVGVNNVGSGKIDISKGRSFEKGDVHYAGGSYSGNMTYDVILDQSVANSLGVDVGDTVHIGSTTVGARKNNFTVIGIGSRFSRFLGASTVTLHLSELQEITGATSTDKGTFITVDLKSSADPSKVKSELENKIPYDVNTNREQFKNVLQNQFLLIAGSFVLVVLAILAGITLTANLLSIVVYHQRDEIAALKAVGVSSKTLVYVYFSQGITFAALGTVFGLALTPVIAKVLNTVASRIVGFQGLVQTPWQVYVGGAVIALIIGVFSSVVASYRVSRLMPLEQFSQ